MMSSQPRSEPSQPLPPLLRTKLHMPTQQPTLIARPRLIARLNGGVQGKLSLIVAPAGFGKTTLAAAWLAQLDAECAWLSLDTHDNDSARFLAYLIAALQTLDTRIGAGLVGLLRMREPLDLPAMMTVLLNDCAALAEDDPARRLILAFDDFHLIENPQIETAVGFWLEQLPPNWHLVIISRIDPELSLARLRARRHMTEIRARDLRLTAEEAAHFLNEMMHLELDEPAVASLRARTEGWIAGLQLAAVALQNTDTESFVQGFAGTHRYIIDYLTDEVFAQQPEAIREFLLMTALLNRMCADLCDAVRAADDSQAFLERIEQLNLFIVPLDDHRRWYRYHHLFADLLRQRASKAFPQLIPELHRRASAWYAALTTAGYVGHEASDEAIYHAAASGDRDLVVALIERFGDRVWESGAHDRLRRWLALLPDEHIALHPKLGIFAGWLSLSGGGYAAAERWLGTAETQIALAAETEPLQRELRGRVAATRAFLSIFLGDSAGTIRAATIALDLLTDNHSTWRGSAAIALGDAHSLRGEIIPAERAYRAALTTTVDLDNIYLSLNASFKLAGTLRQRALLIEAEAVCTAGLARAEAHNAAATAMAGVLHGLRGDILCEWNRLAEADQATRIGVELCERGGHLGFLGWSYLFRGRCLLALRDHDGVAAVIARLDSLPTLPPWIAASVGLLRVLDGWVRGDLGLALAWGAVTDLTPDAALIPGREYEYLMLGRVLALQGRIDDALALLNRLHEDCRASGQHYSAIICLIVLALMSQAKGDHEAAVAVISDALLLAATGGLMRAFIDSGPNLVPLLTATLQQNIAPAYTRALLAAFAEQMPEALQIDLPEKLSERELAVLRLIAAGLKNQEIADQLAVSLNTVLFHTKNIYGKLSVQRRTQAVQRARELGLI
ncbi:MAG: tetratricopeptide repeat protein [Chloroflexi bacterium]|nr:tetratricopeptide repeat protein [Chloroflexota bacterium]